MDPKLGREFQICKIDPKMADSGVKMSKVVYPSAANQCICWFEVSSPEKGCTEPAKWLATGPKLLIQGVQALI